MAAKKELDVFQGTITYNTVSLYANGTKKRFSGFIVMLDANNNEASYKINSFRSQVCIQSEALGERGMTGKKATVHGYFKENTWNGETKWELMAEKIYLEGHEQLAADAEAASTPMPAVPPGQLPGTMAQPIAPVAPAPHIPAGPAPIAVPVAPVPLPPTPGAPMPVNTGGPAPITGGYVYGGATQQQLTPVGAPPAPVAPLPPTAPVAPIQPVAPVAPGGLPTPPSAATPPSTAINTEENDPPPFELDSDPIIQMK